MKKIYISIFITSIIIGGIYYWYGYRKQQEQGFIIRDFVYDKDHQKVYDLFHKHDNWYWMIHTAGTKTYSIDFTLKYATSSQYAKKHDMIMKVATVDGNIAGFCSYHPDLSKKVWRLLFLIVDQDYRRQGIAKKLLQYAVDDMVKLGAIQINIATRNNNFRAQNLYTNFGAKLVDSNDDDFVHFSWYRQNS